MVFHSSKRRVRAKPEIKIKPIFQDLPDELMLAILERTDSISDVLRLRETNRAFVPACSSALQAKLKTLYIHPAPSSVEKAIKICKSPVWRPAIQEICFVNKLDWTMIRANVHLGKKFAHTWPSLGHHEPKNGLNPDFLAHYRILLTALASLPNAKALSFKDRCDEPGFNMVSKQAVAQWADTTQESAKKWDSATKRSGSSRLQKAEEKIYGPVAHTTPTVRRGFNFSDIDAVMAVLGRLNMTSLKMCDELPFANEHSLANASLSRLTHVELLVHLGWQASPWQRFCNELLRGCASTLQTLKLCFQHNPAGFRRQRPETSLATIVKDLDFPNLRSLELRALNLPGKLPYIPQIVDFAPFLSQRCKKLERLRTERVYPTFRHFLITIGPDDYPSMDDILLEFEGEVVAREEQDEFARAWEFRA